MFQVRPASKEDRAKVFEALRQTQEILDQVKSVMDGPSYPDESLITGCSAQIGQQLSRFYVELLNTHSVLTEVVCGYTPDELTQYDRMF